MLPLWSQDLDMMIIYFGNINFTRSPNQQKKALITRNNLIKHESHTNIFPSLLSLMPLGKLVCLTCRACDRSIQNQHANLGFQVYWLLRVYTGIFHIIMWAPSQFVVSSFLWPATNISLEKSSRHQRFLNCTVGFTQHYVSHSS